MRKDPTTLCQLIKFAHDQLIRRRSWRLLSYSVTKLSMLWDGASKTRTRKPLPPSQSIKFPFDQSTTWRGIGRSRHHQMIRRSIPWRLKDMVDESTPLLSTNQIYSQSTRRRGWEGWMLPHTVYQSSPWSHLSLGGWRLSQASFQSLPIES